MTKKELERAYAKALKAGLEMLEQAQRYDSCADANTNEEQAKLQRAKAIELRSLYSKLFD